MDDSSGIASRKTISPRTGQATALRRGLTTRRRAFALWQSGWALNGWARVGLRGSGTSSKAARKMSMLGTGPKKETSAPESIPVRTTIPHRSGQIPDAISHGQWDPVLKAFRKRLTDAGKPLKTLENHHRWLRQKAAASLAAMIGNGENYQKPMACE